ncbi:histidinol-phosphate transaminase [Lacticaseibacillus chiayiensis]|uniref:Histidinol-phosphate aminotransferase n=1 Tax=Lacticaseibacillus chiayiensis TaxID=2100821 RepID=A0A4Q1TUN8_9LACO|nr:histidinol-phosphate transaminase [Lacticaseibacillus chiayiensis]QVI35883.1 histidinol-phosphate transaminase [Lacticaseibacillus chiayiensis]RXT22544.1 histidinol-phosphate transaminase [Lacticaseibacillus chiayiensis]RXT58954.1 histidinol-phosphate transaminase [Lacticaseibacillus chiayiensis]UYN57726.1 histidinol-phosphate transaminase [Lacticaseibacillus chiayiensis]
MLKHTVKHLQPYTPEKPLADLKKELGLASLVRMSANENPFGTSPEVRQAVANWDFTQSRDYPDSNASQLRRSVADQLHVASEQLVFGNGLDEVIALIARAFLEPGDEVVEPWPTFSEYRLHAEIEGARVVDVPVQPENGNFDLDAMVQTITPRTKLVWLCNPNNPTGTLMSLTALTQFMRRVPENVLVLVDEAYIEFTDDYPATSAIRLLPQFNNLVVLRTFSKIYGLANFRVGFGIFPKQLVTCLQAVRLPYNLSAIAQLSAQAALADQTFVQTTRSRVQQARRSWETFLTDMVLPHYTSQTNFQFFQAPHNQAQALKQQLLQHGFLVRDGLMPGWLRITFGTANQNQTVQQVIRTFQLNLQ